ncbi:MAG TPA: hypothetical protein VIO33_24425 [Burkholderiaceae bacterium]
MLARIKQVWETVVTQVFDKEGLEALFMHARNVLTGAAVVAAGLYAIHHVGESHLQGLWNLRLAGYVVAFVGAGLLVLNLIDGLRKLARRRHHLLLRFATILVYVVISMRLTQVIIYFRTAT